MPVPEQGEFCEGQDPSRGPPVQVMKGVAFFSVDHLEEPDEGMDKHSHEKDHHGQRDGLANRSSCRSECSTNSGRCSTLVLLRGLACFGRDWRLDLSSLSELLRLSRHLLIQGLLPPAISI
jgi:hypothetical protein